MQAHQRFGLLRWPGWFPRSSPRFPVALVFDGSTKFLIRRRGAVDELNDSSVVTARRSDDRLLETAKLTQGPIEDSQHKVSAAFDKAQAARTPAQHALSPEMYGDFLTRLREAGMALEAVQAQAGHLSIQSTRVYLHLTNDWLTEEYRRAAALIDADSRACDAAMFSSIELDPQLELAGPSRHPFVAGGTGLAPGSRCQ